VGYQTCVTRVCAPPPRGTLDKLAISTDLVRCAEGCPTAALCSRLLNVVLTPLTLSAAPLTGQSLVALNYGVKLYFSLKVVGEDRPVAILNLG
jgi:hypothetical protein